MLIMGGLLSNFGTDVNATEIDGSFKKFRETSNKKLTETLFIQTVQVYPGRIAALVDVNDGEIQVCDYISSEKPKIKFIPINRETVEWQSQVASSFGPTLASSYDICSKDTSPIFLLSMQEGINLRETPKF